MSQRIPSPVLAQAATSTRGDALQGSSVVDAIAVTGLLFYALFLPLVVGMDLVVNGSVWAFPAGILLFISMYCGVRLAVELRKGASRWFVLIFHLFAYVFLGIAPLAQIAAESFYWAVNPTPRVVIDAAVVCLVGVLLFDIGFFVGARRRLPARAGQVRPVDDRHHGKVEGQRIESGMTSLTDRTLVLLIAASLGGLAIFVAYGGLPLVLASRDEMSRVLCPALGSGDLAECGIVTAMIRVPPVILGVVSLGLMRQNRTQLVWVATLIGLMGLLLTANPISTARFWFGAAAIGVLGVTIGVHLRRRALLWLAAPALLILLFPSLDFGRYRDWSPELNIGIEAIAEKQDFDAFQQIANGVTYVETFGHRNGAQISSAFLFFVPRSLWADKAPATGSLVASSFGVPFTNVSAPLWEEAYIDFGLMGVALVLGGLGYIVSKLESAVASPSSLSGVHFRTVAPFFAGYGVFLLRGSLLGAIGTLAVSILLVALASRLSRRPQTARAWGSPARLTDSS